jgi:hypothetical protein
MGSFSGPQASVMIVSLTAQQQLNSPELRSSCGPHPLYEIVHDNRVHSKNVFALNRTGQLESKGVYPGGYKSVCETGLWSAEHGVISPSSFTAAPFPSDISVRRLSPYVKSFVPSTAEQGAIRLVYFPTPHRRLSQRCARNEGNVESQA